MQLIFYDLLNHFFQITDLLPSGTFNLLCNPPGFLFRAVYELTKSLLNPTCSILQRALELISINDALLMNKAAKCDLGQS